MNNIMPMDNEHAQDYFDFLKKLENDPVFCLQYIEKNPNHEQCLITISKDAKCAHDYARKIRGRFSLGENAISQDPKYAYSYAFYIIKEKWEIGEKAISTSPTYSCQYAVEVLKERFILGEKAISTNAECSYYYARDIIKGRFELGEPAMASEPKWALQYALNVIKGKLPENLHNAMMGIKLAS